MSADPAHVAQDAHAGRRLRSHSPTVETNGACVLLELDEPGVTGIIQIERDTDAGTVHEALAAAYQRCEDIPELLGGTDE